MFWLPAEAVGYCRICQMFCISCRVQNGEQNLTLGYCRICQMYGRNCQDQERGKSAMPTDDEIEAEIRSLSYQMVMGARPATSHGLPAQALRVAQGREQGQGWQPVVTPREVLLAPLFWDARAAARHQTSRIEYDMWDGGQPTRYATQTANPIAPNQEGLDGRKDPSGLLRYLDLDILMALSYEFTRTGQPRITTSQRLLLHLMGYSNIDTAPFREFRASIQRMAATTIVTSGTAAPPDAMAPWRLIALNRVTAGHQGRLGLLDASLSSEWAAATAEMWQVLDMRGYVHLCRTARQNGLARVLYLFLGAITEHRTGEFRCPLSWIQQRFADRRGGPGGAYTYTNPLHPNGRLWAAFKVLTDQKVLRLHEVLGNPNTPEKVLIRGSFAPASTFPRIPDIEPDRQQTLIAIDKFTGEMLNPETLEPIRRLDGKTQEEIADAIRDVSQPKLAVAESDTSPAAGPAPVEANTPAAILPRLRPIIRVKRDVEAEAFATGGWSEGEVARLYLVALYRQHLGEVPKPGGWAAEILRSGWSDEWDLSALRETVDMNAVRKWAYGSNGPLAPLNDAPSRK